MTTNGITGSGRQGRRSGRVAVELGHNVASAERDLPAVLISGSFDPGGAGMASSPLRPTDPGPADVEHEGV